MLDEFKNDTRLVNVKTDDYDVYIGRPSIWGNPFTHIKNRTTRAKFTVNSRNEAIAKYREYILNNPELLSKLPELEGKRLACWCGDKKCHGEILIELINRRKHEI